MGSNYGHLAGFLPFYEELKKRNYLVEFVIRDLSFAHKILDPLGVRYFQAPVFRDQSTPQESTYSYVDLLAQAGFCDIDQLNTSVNVWRNLFELLDATFVIADHAPTAVLAARSLGIPTALFGSGFFIPPNTEPFPIFHIWNNLPNQTAFKNNATVLNNINRVLDRTSKQQVSHICELFDVEARFLCATPEIDHYRDRENEDYWGPYFADTLGAEPIWPETPGVKIFAYLTEKITNLKQAMAALKNTEGSKLVHVPNASPEFLTEHAQQNMVLEPNLLCLSEVLASVDLVIHQGGVGTASACLMAGVKQLIIPTQLEQRMLCARLVSQGFAFGIDFNESVGAYSAAIQGALASPSLAANVEAFHLKYLGFDRYEQLAAMADEIEEILAQKKEPSVKPDSLFE